MKVVVGSPGTWSGLVLRIGQCAFASASMGIMVSALGFSNYTAFWYDRIPKPLFNPVAFKLQCSSNILLSDLRAQMINSILILLYYTLSLISCKSRFISLIIYFFVIYYDFFPLRYQTDCILLSSFICDKSTVFELHC